MTEPGTPSDVTAEDLQTLRRLIVDVATLIVKGHQKEALAALKEVEAIIMREQKKPEPPPSTDGGLPPG